LCNDIVLVTDETTITAMDMQSLKGRRDGKCVPLKATIRIKERDGTENIKATEFKDIVALYPAGKLHRNVGREVLQLNT
jgi:hypothetical protein